MKRLAIISLIAASFLIVGCGEKPKESKSVEKKEIEAPKESVKKEEVKEEKQEIKEEAKIEEAKKEENKKVDVATLYAKCAGCHGSKGEKKALGKSAPIGGMEKIKLIENIKGYKAGSLNKYGMGQLMKGQVSNLNDEEIEALATYISNLK